MLLFRENSSLTGTEVMSYKETEEFLNHIRTDFTNFCELNGSEVEEVKVVNSTPHHPEGIMLSAKRGGRIKTFLIPNSPEWIVDVRILGDDAKTFSIHWARVPHYL